MPYNTLMPAHKVNALVGAGRPISAITGRPIPTEQEEFKATGSMRNSLLSGILDFSPGVGDIKGAQEAITGRNYLTGDRLGGWERGLSALAMLPFIPGQIKGLARKRIPRIGDAIPIYINFREGPRAIEITKRGHVVLNADPVFKGYEGELNRTLVRDIDRYISPLPDDVFIRVSNNPEDFKYLKDKTHKGSKDHFRQVEEGGLSVAKSPEIPSKYGYYVKGKVIGEGTDGEPLLDLGSVEVISNRMEGKAIQHDYDKKLMKKADEMGLSSDDLRLLRSQHYITKQPIGE